MSGNISLGWKDSVSVTAVAAPFRHDTITEQLPPGTMLGQVLTRYQRHGYDIMPILNGEIVEDKDIPFKTCVRGDVLVLRAVPKGGGGGSKILRSILTIAVIAFAAIFAPYLAGLAWGALGGGAIGAAGSWSAIGFAVLKAGIATAITAVGMLGVNALAPLPSQKGAGGQSFSAAGIANQANKYGVVPRLFGTYKIFPYLGAQQFTVNNNNHVYLHALFDLGYGPMNLSNLQFGNTPIGDFVDVEYEIRNGYQDDAPLTLYTKDVDTLALTVGLKVANDAATRRTGTNCDVAQIDLLFPAGLFHQKSNGKRETQSVHFSVQAVDVATGLTTFSNGYTYTENSVQQVANTIEIGLAGSQYDITVTRTTAKVPVPSSGDALWSALRSIRNSTPINVKGHTLVAIKIKADDQLNGQISDFNCVATALVRKWNGTSFTDVGDHPHPAWAFLEILTGSANHNPQLDEKIDLDRLLQWETEYPDAEFHAYLDQPSTLLKTLQDVCSAGRAAFTLRDMLFSVAIDAPQSTPVQMLTPHNILSFRGSQQYLDEIQGARARFISKDADYQQDEVIVYMSGYDDTNSDFTKFDVFDLIGITDGTKASKQALYFLAAATLRPAQYIVEMDWEYLVAQKGDLIVLQHDTPLLGLMAGRVKAITLSGSDVTGLVLDEPVTMENDKNYSIRIRFDDLSMATYSVTPINGTTDTITFITPVAQASTGVAVKNLFSFGETGIEVRECLVKAVQPKNNIQATVTLIDYSPDIYTADGGTIPPYNPGINLPPVPVQPKKPIITSLACDESTSLRTDGGHMTPRIRLTWVLEETGTTPTGFEVQYGTDGSEILHTLAQLPAGTGTVFISPVDLGETYDVRIRSISGVARKSDWVTETIVTAGLSSPPPDPTGGLVTPIPLGLILHFDPPEDPRAATVNVYYGTTPVFADAQPFFTGISKGPITLSGLEALLPYYVWIEHQDPSGNVSANMAGPFTATPLDIPGDAISKLLQKALSPVATVRQSVANQIYLPWLDTMEQVMATVAQNITRLEDVHGIVRDAGIVRDPANAEVQIYAVNALSTSLSSFQTLVTATFDALNADIELKVSTTTVDQKINAALSGLTPLYRWEFESDTASWSANNATISASAGILTFSATGATPYLTSPAVSIDPSVNTVIQMRIKATAGVAWGAQLKWGGGFVNIATFATPTDPTQWNVVQVDLSGTASWTGAGTITAFEITLGDATSTFLIDWITVGSPSSSSTAINDLSTRVTAVESSVTLINDAIALLASKTVTDSLSASISVVQAELDANTASIALKAAQADLTATNASLTTVQLTLNAQAGQIEQVLGFVGVTDNGNTPEQISANMADGFAAMLAQLDLTKAIIGYARDGLYQDLLGEQAIRISAVTELHALVNGNAADILSVQSAFASADAAEAIARTAGDAQLTNIIGPGFTTGSTITAQFLTEQTARANGDSANASSIIGIQSALTGYLGANAISTAFTNLTTSVNLRNRIFVQGAAPTALAVGDTWVDTSNGNTIKVWDGAAWQDRSDLNRNHVFAQTSTPTAIAVGDLWINTTGGNNLMSRWNGSTWVSVDNPVIASTASAVTSIQSALNGYTGASAVANAFTSLNTTVTNQGSTISSQATAITGIQSALSGYLGVNAVSTAFTNLTTTVTTKNTIFVQGTAPTALSTGDMWVDTANGNTVKVWDGAAWVARTDLNKNHTFAQTSTPTAGAVGDIWINTTGGANTMSRWNGTSWAAIDNPVIAATASAVTSINSALSGYTGAGAVASAFSSLTTRVTTIESENGATVFVQGTTPTANAVADIWVDTAHGNTIKTWDGAAWVDRSDLNRNRTFAQTATPTATAIGDLWVETDNNNKIWRWNGSAWVDLDNPIIATSASAITSIQSALTGYTGASAVSNAFSSLTTTVNVKNTIFVQSSTPTANIVGDLWVDTGNGNVIKTWTGASWTARPDLNKVKTFAQGTAPTAAAIGDIWIDTGNNNSMHRWDGASWVVVDNPVITTTATAVTAIQSALSGYTGANAVSNAFSTLTTNVSLRNSTFVQSLTPVALSVGDLWVDTGHNNTIKAWNGSTWVDRSDLNRNRTFAQTTTPTATAVGDIWIDTSNNNSMSRWNGTAWAAIDNPQIAASASAITSIQSALSGYAGSGAVSTAFSSLTTNVTTINNTIGGSYSPSNTVAAAITAQATATTSIQSALAGYLTANAVSSAFSSLTTTVSNKNTIFVQNTQPTANENEDLWIDTGHGNRIKQWSVNVWLDRPDLNKVTTFAQSAAPTAAAVGDIWVETDNNNKMWRWNGSAWVDVDNPIIAASASAITAIQSALSGYTTSGAVSSAFTSLTTTANSKSSTFVQGTTPVANAIGDIWINTSNKNQLLVWSGSAWVARPDLNKITTFAQNATPTAAAVGDLWIETDNNNKLWRWNGTSWVAVDDGRIATSAAAITSIQSALTGYSGASAVANAVSSLNTSVTTVSNTIGGTYDPTHTVAADIAINTSAITAINASLGSYTGSSAVASAINSLNANVATKNTIFAQTATPTGNIVGDLWVDIGHGNTISTWNGTSWSPRSDLNRNRTFAQGSAPTATAVGDIWINTSSNNIMSRWNGTSWVAVDDSRIASSASAITTINSALTGYLTASGVANAFSTLTTNVQSVQDDVDTKNTVFVQNTQPTANRNEDLWIDTGHGNKIKQWSVNVWLDRPDLNKVTTFAQTTAPTAAAVGDIWVDTSNNNSISRWSGSAWVAMDNPIIAANASAITSINSTIGNAFSPSSTISSAFSSLTTTVSGKNTVWVQNFTPSTPIGDDLWVDTGHGNKFKSYDDTNQVWVDRADLNKVTTFAQAAAPTAAAVGDIWVETDNNNKLWRWSGSAWVAVDDTRIANNATAITSINSTLSGYSPSNTVSTAFTQMQTNVDAKNTVFVQGTQPTAIQNEDLWIDTAHGNKIKQWSVNVWLDRPDLNKTTTFAQSATPTAAAVGDVWVETDNNNKIWRWNGSAWVDLDNPTISTSATAITQINSTLAGFDSSNTVASAMTGLVTKVNSRVHVFAQSATPTATGIGDLWFTTAAGHAGKYWNGSAWIAIPNITSVTTFVQTATPTAVNVGDIWVNTTGGANSLLRWDGTIWAAADDLSSSSLAAFQLSLKTTVDGHTTSLSSIATTIGTYGARWGVQIDVNGAVTGLVTLDSSGSQSAFTVVASSFKIFQPGGSTPLFALSGGVAQLNVPLKVGSINATNLIVDNIIQTNHLDSNVVTETGGWLVDQVSNTTVTQTTANNNLVTITPSTVAMGDNGGANNFYSVATTGQKLIFFTGQLGGTSSNTTHITLHIDYSVNGGSSWVNCPDAEATFTFSSNTAGASFCVVGIAPSNANALRVTVKTDNENITMKNGQVNYVIMKR